MKNRLQATLPVDTLGCGHTDDTGLCHCESGMRRCPSCQTWLGINHANKDVHAMSDQPTQTGLADFYKRGLEVGDYTIGDIVMMLARCELALQSPCPKCGEKS